MAKYRLQALVEIRERAEEEAKNSFAEATQALRAEEDTLKELEDELEAMIADRLRRREDYAQKLASGEMKVTDQAAAYRYIDRMKEQEQEQRGKIDGQRENVRDAEKHLKLAQDALIEATQDLKALEKHKEKWAAAIKKKRQLAEEDNLDEIAQVIFTQKKLKGE